MKISVSRWEFPYLAALVGISIIIFLIVSSVGFRIEDMETLKIIYPTSMTIMLAAGIINMLYLSHYTYHEWIGSEKSVSALIKYLLWRVRYYIYLIIAYWILSMATILTLYYHMLIFLIFMFSLPSAALLLVTEFLIKPCILVGIASQEKVKCMRNISIWKAAFFIDAAQIIVSFTVSLIIILPLSLIMGLDIFHLLLPYLQMEPMNGYMNGYVQSYAGRLMPQLISAPLSIFIFARVLQVVLRRYIIGPADLS